MNHRLTGLYILLLVSVLFSCARKEAVYHFNPGQGNTIVFIRNTFAVALEEHNYFETVSRPTT
jgi:hypothetical protein